MAARKQKRRCHFPRNALEELWVSASAHFIHVRCFKTDEDHAQNMLFSASLREPSAERVRHIEVLIVVNLGKGRDRSAVRTTANPAAQTPCSAHNKLFHAMTTTWWHRIQISWRRCGFTRVRLVFREYQPWTIRSLLCWVVGTAEREEGLYFFSRETVLHLRD